MSSGEDSFEVPAVELNNLKPNHHGHYTLCFHCNRRQPPLEDPDEIKELFSSVAPVASIASCKGLQFVRFSSKSLALKAWKAFRKSLQIKVADHKGDKNSEENDDRSNDDTGCDMLFVGNICLEATNEELQDYMSEIIILDWRIFRRDSKCYAFLKASDHKEAERAIKMYNNKVFMNRKLTVRELRNFEPEPPRSESRNPRASTEVNDNYKTSQTFPKSSNSSSRENYDDLRARMPPLEDIVSSSDDDNDGDESDVDESDAVVYAKNSRNRNTRHANMNNSLHLFVGNFPYGTNEINLMNLFQSYDPIKAIITNSNDKSRSTQGFVCFSDLRNVRQATEEMDCTEYNHHILLVTSSLCSMNIAKEEKLPQSTTTAGSQYHRHTSYKK